MIFLQDIVNGSMPVRTQIVAVVGSLLLLVIIMYLIRKERLKEGYSILWLLVGIAMVIFSVFAGLLDQLAHLVGIAYAPAVLFLILVAGLFVLALHFSLLLSRYDKRIRRLAQEHAILKEQINKEKGVRKR